jgi:hypothetical protein
MIMDLSEDHSNTLHKFDSDLTKLINIEQLSTCVNNLKLGKGLWA